ncbi:hypothetical protein [Aureispira anguillae]|uniref:DUF3221 domain-containing protein n=1 Tax=Aureispira anguillae TaxID=2864201 RepID=A0A916DTG4_9BACT|nr:hypothetical protein [Aureispira anguillae]BDS11772.1 hypothetical protein AsAng_0024860 [Aureispira anguillae]
MYTKLKTLLIALLFTTFFVTQGFASNSFSPPPGEQETLQFIIYYEGDILKTMNNKNSVLGTFTEIYELKVVETIKMDEFSERVLLEVGTKVDEPVELAKEISLADNVLMVEVLNPVVETHKAEVIR